MTSAAEDKGPEITYLGWSGFHMPGQGSSAVYIDPPKGTASQDVPTVVFITHGHPEHLGGVLDLVKTQAAASLTIVGSKAVCAYLKRQCTRPHVRFEPVTAGSFFADGNGVRAEVFTWRHMPLLPPGFMPACRHVWRLLCGWRKAAGIIRMMLTGPRRAGEMLGFVLSVGDDMPVIAYGEGLHRRTRLGEVRAVAGALEKACLLVAVEPEDVAALPWLLRASAARFIRLYEPHGGWRDDFGMPRADLRALAGELRQAGKQVRGMP